MNAYIATEVYIVSFPFFPVQAVGKWEKGRISKLKPFCQWQQISWA